MVTTRLGLHSGPRPPYGDHSRGQAGKSQPHITRLGLHGGPRMRYSSFSKAVAAAGATISQIAPGISQSITATQIITGTVTQTTPGASQALTATQLITGTITQTTPGITQSITATQLIPGTIIQVLPAVTQSVIALSVVAPQEDFGGGTSWFVSQRRRDRLLREDEELTGLITGLVNLGILE